MKTAIVAIAKNEDHYINEWLDYHFGLGFDNIIVCDNDDELILPSIISDQRVIIEDFTGLKNIQQITYKQMFLKYRSDFDWIFIIDIDEFLVLEKDSNVKDFLSNFPDEVESINLCSKNFTDNDELDVVNDNYNVLERFTHQVSTRNDSKVKCFIRQSIKDDYIRRLTQHAINDKNVYAVNAKGDKIYNGPTTKIVYEGAWINHYRTKTIGEFIRQKYFRGGLNFNDSKYHNLRYFWEINEYTPEKEAYAKQLIEKLA